MLYQHTNVRASECGMSPNFHAPALLVLSILQVFTAKSIRRMVAVESHRQWSVGMH